MTGQMIPSYARMTAEHFGISIPESDARILHERVQVLINKAYNHGVQNERTALAHYFDVLKGNEFFAENIAEIIRARGTE